MLGYVPSIFVLDLAAIVAFVLAQRRESHREYKAERKIAANAMSITVAMQCIHFAEEALKGFRLCWRKQSICRQISYKMGSNE